MSAICREFRPKIESGRARIEFDFSSLFRGGIHQRIKSELCDVKISAVTSQI
jgi:type I restriction-modification system DNA methylase subunit